MRIQVRREAVDGLSAKVWSFWYADGRHALILDYYAEEMRASKRHKFRAPRTYERLGHPRQAFTRIPEADVPLPDDVREEAVRNFVAKLVVAKASEVRV